MALLPHAESVTVITRGAEPRAKRPLVSRLEQAPGARVLVRRSVNAVVGETGVSGLILRNTETDQTETFPVDAVFVGVGQFPVTGFLTGCVELNEGGFIVTDDLLQTSAPGVFAAGDVRNTPLRQIITAAADGALAVQSAVEYLQRQP
jgi:thioredoxin reductase (NADPH)